MKKYRTFLITLFLILFVILLTACENSAAQSNRDSNEHTYTDLSKEDKMMMELNNASNTSAENKATTNLQKEYLNQLNKAKAETEAMQPIDNSTYALKKVASDQFDKWDGLLNEIYGDLENLLSDAEMAKLREKQREWIIVRDETAKQASLKYEGGTMEQLEYVTMLAELTKERCYELVQEYIAE
ncbi:lysozyme inhibitor LprI family protein [Gracilibacillus massiliensis]|uniref:lysozyme inhibitor LprI family protein n=1 Tax=Gracilibacillus massiliensis TaxID=1564956 RepID=UPI00071CB645|nr:lysozyme inhibitor LprI family protein [Gracilibacillus massiliensis]